MDLKEAIHEKTQEIAEEIIAWRRRIHMHPELELDCHETAGFVSRILSGYGLEVVNGFAQTGVVGILRGEKSGPVVALRVDMDALPIQEQNNLPYASQKPGLMHACGHDGHTAIGLGVAAVLSQLKASLKGTVKFIFQPGEENPGGAKLMLEEGVLQNPDVAAMFGFHIFPDIPAGIVGVNHGAVCAGNDDFEITLTGKGGHGAKPEQCVDPIVAAAHLITSVQSIVSRSSDPRSPLVISICQVSGGNSYNVIPQEVFLKGTIRTLRKDTQEIAHRRLSEVLKGIEAGFGVSAHLRMVTDEPPPLRNDLALARFAQEKCAELMGEGAAQRLDTPSMGADDFAYFTTEVPAAYLRLGCCDEERGYVHKLHTPRFDFDESVLIDGTKLFSWLLISFLNDDLLGGKHG